MYRSTAVAERLADRAVACAEDAKACHCPDPVTLSILDGFGQFLYARRSPFAMKLKRAFPTTETSGGLAVDNDWTLDPESAVTVLGALVHANDWDDIGGGGGHPSAVLLPPLLVEADERSTDPQFLAVGFIAGYEVASLIIDGLAAKGSPRLRGPWQASALVGPIGAATAICIAREYDRATIAKAIAIAASLSSGYQANFGTDMKPMQLGVAGARGRKAVALARAGLEGEPTILEHDNGFGRGFGTSPDWDKNPRWDAATLLVLQDSSLDTVGHGPYVKLHPVCGGTNPSLTALKRTLEAAGRSGDEIASIDVIESIDRGSAALFRTDPRTGHEGKFSIKYVLTAYCLLGSVTTAAFGEDAYSRIRHSQLWSDINIHHEQAIAEGGSTTILETRFLDGGVHQETIVGRGEVASPSQVVGKFHQAASRTVHPGIAKRIADALMKPPYPDLRTSLELSASL